ncbi:hypothetical protein [Bifidobacterium breve]|nr:hypothetical protein [Bifidobacterium breve]MEB3518020.1 hypothetical protein [Bifidobacterium breve]
MYKNSILKTASLDTSIFYVCLFVLTIINELPRVYFFSNIDALNGIFRLLQISIYICLFALVLCKRYKISQLVIFVIAIAILGIGYYESDNGAFVSAFLLICASKDFYFESIIKVCGSAVAFVFCISISLYVLNISNPGDFRRNGLSLGYVHPNIAAQVIFILLMIYLACKHNNLLVKDYVVIIIVFLFVYTITGSRTTAILILLCPIVIPVNKFFVKHKSKIAMLFISLLQFIVFLFSVFSAKLLPQYSALKKLDLILSNRLFLNYYALSHNPMSLLGKKIDFSADGLVYNDIQNVYNAKVTLDSTYILGLLSFGIIPFAIFLLVYVYIVWKFFKYNNYLLITICALLAVYAFSESQMVQIYNFFVYFAVLTKIPSLVAKETN